nr:MAG TPA: hypothetical protein [Caudoviricetes sp.]
MSSHAISTFLLDLLYSSAIQTIWSYKIKNKIRL